MRTRKTAPVVIALQHGVPTRIKISSINVDAAIELTGLLPDGSMGTPQTAADTAWYDLGPHPGEIGSAVIDGHLDWKDGSRAVFADLDKVKPGDIISVEDAQGITSTFKVREIRNYSPTSNASEVFTSHDGRAHLNLITCSGVWDKTAQGYSQRLIVFADQQ